MKILVIGNLGYIGPIVCKYLKTTLTNSEIVGLDTGYFSSCITTNDRLGDTYCDQQIFKDIRDIDVKICRGFDTLILLSAISNDPISNNFDKITDEINHLALGKLVKDFGALSDKTIVFASSCSIYGTAGVASKKENDNLNPLTAYARSKVAVEEVLANIKLAPGTIATSLRFATACGMSERLRLDLVLNSFVASAMINGKVVVPSNGKSWRPLINIKDMARAIEWAIARGFRQESPHLVVNVGSNNWNYTLRQLAEAVVEKISDVELELNQSIQPDKRSYKVNFDLFKKIAPDHQPQSSLNETIYELIKGITPIKHLIGEDFQSSNLIRLNTIKNHLNTDRLSPQLRWRI